MSPESLTLLNPDAPTSRPDAARREPRASADVLKEVDSPPWRLITSREASRLLGVSIQVLANYRVRGNGPAFHGTIRGKGNKVSYRKADVLAFRARQRGHPEEAWWIVRDWLMERGLELDCPSPEGIWWLAEAVDAAFP